jgi:hypothetical protein
MLKDTPYNDLTTPWREKQTNSNDSKEVHMIFRQAPPEKPARVTAKKLQSGCYSSIEKGFTVPAEKLRSIVKIDQNKNSSSEKWMSFET